MRRALVAGDVKDVPMTYAQHFHEHGKTPQSEQADPRQVKNTAGGFTFQLDHWKRLERFLILGTEGGTFYAGERKLAIENAKSLGQCIDEDPARVVNLIVQISDSGRAPKNDEAIFALAVAAANPKSAGLALAALPKVCRIGTHLFQFVEAVSKFRGWGPKLRKAIGAWYNDRELDDLIRQVTKYQQRNGVSNKGLFRRSHFKPKASHQPVYRWVVDPMNLGERQVLRKAKGTTTTCGAVGPLPELLLASDQCLHTKDPKEAIRLIEKYRLPHEVVPKELQSRSDVMAALLEHMPIHATIRSLGKLTASELLKPMSHGTDLVVKRLTDERLLRQKRVHPIQILLATKVYETGHGEKGKLMWAPVRAVLDALDEAFYLSFGSIEPTRKRTLLAIDISRSMDHAFVAGTSLSARVAAGAMAMVTARVEPAWHAVGFTSGEPGEYRHGHGGSMHHGYYSSLTDLKISTRQRLDDITKAMAKLPLGGTDCALPMLYAMDKGMAIDVFHIYTDNETWAGNVHPHQAMKMYRDRTGIAAKLVVVGMTATEFTIADPNDAGMMDVVGFDAAAPSVIADFAR